MNKEPLVSIICTVFNKGPWLGQAIEGFLNQVTTFDFEILLIDDASTDDSWSVMEVYQNRYPDKIKTFYNEKNLGISKTWYKICKEAKGKYIARCDGDDFWLNPLKLQRQVDALEANPASKWSNCDFDIYSEDGKIISKSGFENSTIPLADTYEKMLATRGFTMASTWLVERELMLEVNEELDLATADDTFNLQMDLFQRTELSYIPEAMVAYRINQGSDSRPKDFSKQEDRFHKLLQTQLSYLNKYPNADYQEIARILLDRVNHFEIELSKSKESLAQYGIQQVTIYLYDSEKGFTEEKIIQYPLNPKDQITLTVPSEVEKIRVDLSELPAYYKKVQLINQNTDEILLPVYSNGVVIGESYLFSQKDPQLIYEIKEEKDRNLLLKYETFDLDHLDHEFFIGKIFSKNAKELVKVIDENHILKLQLEELTKKYNAVISSRRWTIPTKIIDFLKRKKKK